MQHFSENDFLTFTGQFESKFELEYKDKILVLADDIKVGDTVFCMSTHFQNLKQPDIRPCKVWRTRQSTDTCPDCRRIATYRYKSKTQRPSNNA